MDDDDANSWLRRAKFSHTVCHRFDSSKLGTFPLAVDSEILSGAKSRSRLSNSKLQIDQKISNGSFFISKQRAVSPLPQTVLSDSFKEARGEKKRFSTPHGRGREREKGLIVKLFSKDFHEPKLLKSASNSPREKTKNRKETPWTKYFDHAGGRVNNVGSSDDSNVDMAQLFLGLRFAHGAHSKLYHGIYKEQPVAVKIIRVPDDDENVSLATKLEHQFTTEVTLLSQLHHPNVIKFVASCRKKPVYCIITEYLCEGSLRSYLHKLEQKALPMEKVVAMALDIARGMAYVHSQGIIHRDLKPENVIIGEKFRLKLADFGIACRESCCDTLADDPGTYRWMAPEMIKRKSYNRKVDVYSFGLILWELVSGRIPYEEMNPIQAAFAVVNKNLRPVVPEDCPSAMRALVEQCWKVQPEKRPEFWQIVKVLEVFEASIGRDGTLSMACSQMSSNQKKGLLHWIQRLGPLQPSGASQA